MNQDGCIMDIRPHVRNRDQNRFFGYANESGHCIGWYVSYLQTVLTLFFESLLPNDAQVNRKY
jgi:hypothetical protein